MKKIIFIFAVIILLSSFSINAAEYGFKFGYLYIGEYDFSGPVSGIRDRAHSTLVGFDRWTMILPVLYFNFEIAHTRSEEDIDFGPGIISSYETRITPISGNLLLNVGSDFIQLYAGGGFGGYYVKNTFHILTPDVDITGSETDWYWGYQLKAGLKFWFSDSFGIYSEYQYRRFGESMTITTDFGNLNHDDDVILSHICAGIIFRF